MPVNADNQGSNIALARNPVFHDRSKHIDIQYHYTRDLVKEKRIKLEYVPTKDMLADLLTKSLPPLSTSICLKVLICFDVCCLRSACSEGVVGNRCALRTELRTL